MLLYIVILILANIPKFVLNTWFSEYHARKNESCDFGYSGWWIDYHVRDEDKVIVFACARCLRYPCFNIRDLRDRLILVGTRPFGRVLVKSLKFSPLFTIFFQRVKISKSESQHCIVVFFFGFCALIESHWSLKMTNGDFAVWFLIDIA